MSLHEGLSSKPRKVSEDIHNFLEKHITELLNAGVIEPTKAPFAAPVVVVPKAGGDYRMCVDYRQLNKKTIRDVHPLPLLKRLLYRMRGAKYFTKQDLKSGYYQIKVNPEDKYKTAFVTEQGVFQFRVMPFGLINAHFGISRRYCYLYC